MDQGWKGCQFAIVVTALTALLKARRALKVLSLTNAWPRLWVCSSRPDDNCRKRKKHDFIIVEGETIRMHSNHHHQSIHSTTDVHVQSTCTHQWNVSCMLAKSSAHAAHPGMRKCLVHRQTLSRIHGEQPCDEILGLLRHVRPVVGVESELCFPHTLLQQFTFIVGKRSIASQ